VLGLLAEPILSLILRGSPPLLLGGEASATAATSGRRGGGEAFDRSGLGRATWSPAQDGAVDPELLAQDFQNDLSNQRSQA
jgi:hypothetical protein